MDKTQEAEGKFALCYLKMTGKAYAVTYFVLAAALTGFGLSGVIRHGDRLAWALVAIGVAQMIVATITIIKRRRETNRNQ